MRRIISTFAVVSLLSIQACATVFNSGSQSIVANTMNGEEGVAVQINTPNGSYKSRLPSTIVTNPSSFQETEIVINDKCYETAVIPVGKRVTPSFWANFLWITLFPVGMGIDYLTGDMWKLDQQISVPLNKKKC